MDSICDKTPLIHREENVVRWSHLNSDVVELIFSRLPEASVLRAASTCKRWYFVSATQTFSDFYKRNKDCNSCYKFVYRANGLNYAFTQHFDGQGGFVFGPADPERYAVPTVSCPEDGDIPTMEAAGGLHLAFTGPRQTTLRYKLSLLEKKWRTTPDLPYLVEDPVVAALVEATRHKLVVIGGLSFYSGDEEDLAVSVYDERTNSWRCNKFLPKEFRGYTSSLFMGAVVHRGTVFAYSMYSGYVSRLHMDSERWSPVVKLRPWGKVSQSFLVSRAGVLYLVGARDSSDRRDISVTVWNVLDEFKETMRVGELVHSSTLTNCTGAAPRSLRTHWASSSFEMSSSILGALLFRFLQFVIYFYSVTRRSVCFVQDATNSMAAFVQKRIKPCSRVRLETE